jgi:hypothetical protein
MPQYVIKQSQTARHLFFLMVDSTDHITGKTGLSPTVTLSKNGAAFGAPSGAVTELASGWYKLAGNATDSNTLGPLLLHATGAAADPCDAIFEVVAYDPDDVVRFGLTALPNAAAGANGGLPTVDANDAVKVQSGTGANQISLASGLVTVGTNNDKTGYTLSAAGVQAIWDALTSALTTVGSIGKLIADNLNSTISGIPTAVWAAGTRTLTAFAFSVTVGTNNDKTGYSLTSGERTDISDALLDRDMSIGSDSGSPTVRTVRQALRALRNRFNIAATTRTVYKEDDVTASWTSTIQTDASAEPIVGDDPAG